MPNILQISNTLLDGNPLRLSKLINKYSKDYRSRCLTWEKPNFTDQTNQDFIGSMMSEVDIVDKFSWANIVHIHGSCDQEVFKKYPKLLQISQLVVQVYGNTVDTPSVTFSGVCHPYGGFKPPIAVTPRYGGKDPVDYLVLDPIDVTDDEFKPLSPAKQRKTPIVKLLKEDNLHPFVRTILQQQRSGAITLLPEGNYAPVVEKEFRKGANVAVDAKELGTYSTSLDYLACGIPSFCSLRDYIQKNIELLTGAKDLPWNVVNRDSFLPHLLNLIHQPSKVTNRGRDVRKWMQKYWSPQTVLEHYEGMYKDLL